MAPALGAKGTAAWPRTLPPPSIRAYGTPPACSPRTGCERALARPWSEATGQVSSKVSRPALRRQRPQPNAIHARHQRHRAQLDHPHGLNKCGHELRPHGGSLGLQLQAAAGSTHAPRPHSIKHSILRARERTDVDGTRLPHARGAVTSRERLLPASSDNAVRTSPDRRAVSNLIPQSPESTWHEER